MGILALLQCLQPYVTTTALRQFSRIAQAMLAMTGRVTMLGISRWAGEGGSYRTVQRFFYCQALPWASLLWVFFRQHLHLADHTYLTGPRLRTGVAGDEVVVTKAGKHTCGLDRFFSSLVGKPVPGVAFFALSLIDVQARHSFPLRLEQVIRTAAEKAASQAKAEARQQNSVGPKRPRGRPKGSQNKKKAEVTLTPELTRIQAMLAGSLTLIAGWLAVTYVVMDGHFGNHHAMHMVRQCQLQLISKLRSDAALYLPYAGGHTGRGARRKYGDKLDYAQLPDRYRKATTTEGQLLTCTYQMECLHQDFAQPLNVVILVKTNLQTQARAHVILFSSDRCLAADQLVDYYSLRFQIEFNFRDAKQYFGLEDFMNVTETAITNAANLSLFMVNLSYCLRRDLRHSDPDYSILDLKALCRGYKYVDETLKMLPEKPEPVLLARIFQQVAALGRIHPTRPVASTG